MPHEPKKKHSRARQGKRRASIRLEIPGFNLCQNCKATVYPHTICKKCGFYNGEQVLSIKKIVHTSEKNPPAGGNPA